MTLDLSSIEKFLSRKLAALLLLGTLLFQLPDCGNPWIIITKIVIGGGAVVVYTFCNAKQNIAQIKYTNTVPTNGDDTEVTTGATTEPKK